MLKAIAACDRLGGIGRNGSLPWPKNTADLKWFKTHTDGCTVVMGSKTWNDPLFPKPLPNRRNVVISKNTEFNDDRADVIRKNVIEEVLQMENVWIIGGASVFNLFFPFIDEFYLTRFGEDYDCDTFIPLLEISRWDMIYRDHPFIVYKRPKVLI